MFFAVLFLFFLMGCTQEVADEMPQAGTSFKDLTADTIIDDFTQEQLWYYGFYGEGGEQNVGEISHNEEGYVEFNYELDQGDYPYDPYIEFVRYIDSLPVDLSNFDGIEYRYRGTGHMFKIPIADVTDYNYHFITVEPSTVWRRVRVNFAGDLIQPSWTEEEVTFRATSVQSFNWMVMGPSGTAGTLEIDDITLLYTMSADSAFDMDLQEPEIPAKSTLLPFAANALQERLNRVMAKGIALSGWLENDSDFPGYTYDESAIEALAAQGFTAVTLPVDLDRWISNFYDAAYDDAPIELDPALFEILDFISTWTERHGLALTIEYREMDNDFNYLSARESSYCSMMARLWKLVAEHYAESTREDLFFSLFDEPGYLDDITSDQWRLIAAEMVDSIRSADATRPVIYGTAQCRIDELTAQEPLADDDYLIYAFKSYAPFLFSANSGNWRDGYASVDSLPFPYARNTWSTEYSFFGVTDDTPAWVKAGLDEYFQNGNAAALFNQYATAKNWATEHNVPLICSDMGLYRVEGGVDETSQKNYYEAIAAITEECEIPWSVYSGVHGSDGAVDPIVVDALGLN